jgi:hypothetical protein
MDESPVKPDKYENSGSKFGTSDSKYMSSDEDDKED